jgi:hypothetical protein
MNRTGRLLRSGLGLLLLVGLAAAATWVILQSRPQSPQVAQGSPLATPTARPPQPPSPPPLPTQAADRVPFCTFPGGPPPDRGGPGLDRYQFSEPRIVFTSTSGIFIADWLPDNNRLLIMRNIPLSNLERIETLDTRTGEVQLYAERDGHNGKPVWLPAIQGVAYSHGLPHTLELRISRGQPPETTTVVASAGNNANLGFSLAVEPGGRHLMYLVDRAVGRLQSWDSVARTNQATAFDVGEWLPPLDLSRPNAQYFVTPIWNPNGTRLAIFAGQSLFLVEPGVNRVCEVNRGRWLFIMVTASQWSPNGRYLAVTATTELPDPLVRSTELVVLDVLTGDLRRLPLPVERRYVTTVVWSANSQCLAVLNKVSSPQDWTKYKLFLVDVVTGDVRPMWPEHIFGTAGRPGEQMAWSRNGRLLALECPAALDVEGVPIQDGVCLVSTEIRP